MATLFGLLRKKQAAWFFLVVTAVSAVAWGWACKINYTTTFTQLNKVTPREAAIMFTLAIQSFEFLIPAIAVLGITNALKVSRELKTGLNIAWFVVIAVDFGTALQYFIGVYEVTTFWSWMLSSVLAGMFLVAEMLFVLSLVTMYVVYKMLVTGTVPEWVTDPQKDSVDIPGYASGEPSFGNIRRATGRFFRPSGAVRAAGPASATPLQPTVRPDAKQVPDGTTWSNPDGRRTYVLRNGKWELQMPPQQTMTVPVP